ncbi:MAG: hypothetical protein DRQ55_08450 [Planctomycetota bacterium]|nr:MAG: hypothetical protein DRQ55_08450 [Planctomycetota bacterium]
MPAMPNDPLLVLAVVVAAGLAGGALARRVGLAGVTGQILAGVALGEAGLGLLGGQQVASLSPVTAFALGLITLVVGGHLSLRRLRNAGTRLLLLVLAEATLIPLLVYVVVAGPLDRPWTLAVLLAALAVSTAPATIVALVAESRSRGVFTKTLMGAVALNNIAAIFLFELAHLAAVTLGEGVDIPAWQLVLEPLRELGVTIMLGGGVGLGLVYATRKMVQSDRLATASVIAVLLVSGLAGALGVSALLSCLFLGMTLANLTPDKDEIVESAFVDVRQAIFAVFFTLAGAQLHLDQLGGAGWLVLAVFATRLVGKVLAAHLALRIAGGTRAMRRWIGLALTPQAGVAVGLILLAYESPALADIGPELLNAGLAIVALNELVGPSLVRMALVRSGEANHDRARLLDFLHEENIVVDLKADTMEAAIEQLVDVLVRTNHLDADRDALLASVLQREREVSTCFGEGLAVPHGVHESGQVMAGAMGISRQGLDFDTPDGRPVHCMVVLATPANERDRHLQVLAALARAIGVDPNVRRQLFAARTAAHAYDVLHGAEASHFNAFLDEDEDDAS